MPHQSLIPSDDVAEQTADGDQQNATALFFFFTPLCGCVAVITVITVFAGNHISVGNTDSVGDVMKIKIQPSCNFPPPALIFPPPPCYS